MFRICFRLSIPEVEGTVDVGEMFSNHDDPWKALADAKVKKAGLVQALRAAMPMLGKVEPENIEIGIYTYNPQLLLDIPIPKKKRTEVRPAEVGFQLFVHDSDPTLSNQT